MGVGKLSNVDVGDIDNVSSASDLSKISGVEFSTFGNPLVVRLSIANDGDSWDPRVKMFSGTGVIDWGDGTPTESVSTVLPSPHTYATAGTYDVTLTPLNGGQTKTVSASLSTRDTQVTEVVAFGDCRPTAFSYWESLVTIPLNGYLDLTQFFSFQTLRDCSSFVGPTSMAGYATLSPSPNISGCFLGATLFNRPGLNDLDTSSVTSMRLVFSGASAFNQPLDNWVVSIVTDMVQMFASATAFNQDISGWDVSSVTDMRSMFSGAQVFNQDISGWNVSSVDDMNSMLSSASAFNQDISGWNVSSVTDMSFMFSSADAFNQPLNSWVVSSVTDMEAMFAGNDAFNQDISGWDVSSVDDMSAMFASATAFDQDISGWNVSSVTDMSSMFADASVFDQDIGAWTFKNSCIISGIFRNSGMSDANVALCLEGWDSVGQGTSVDATDMFGSTARTMSESTYSNAKTAYDNLISTYSWDFTGSFNWVA